jgi:tRNA (guanine-N7-)-methyltransferase
MAKSPLALKETILNRQSRLRGQLEDVCAGKQEVTLEIGCGHGHFLAAYAEAHPEELCIGVDLLLGRLTRADRKRHSASISNLHFLKGDAWELLTVWPANVTIRNTWILFPDPWPKRRHEDRRLVGESFLYLLAQHSSVNSRMYFRTDYIPYLDWVRECVSQHKRWDLLDAPFPFEQDTVFQRRAESFGSLVAQCRPC